MLCYVHIVTVYALIKPPYFLSHILLKQYAIQMANKQIYLFRECRQVGYPCVLLFIVGLPQRNVWAKVPVDRVGRVYRGLVDSGRLAP